MFEIVTDAFSKILGPTPKLHLIASGFALTEGPVFIADKQSGYFFFTDQKKNTIHCLRWNGLGPYEQITELSYDQTILFKHPAHIANGMTADKEGRLVIAEAGGRRITRIERDGKIKTLTDHYKNKRFNSPNDVVVKSNGTVWFTDPNYGCLGFGSLNTEADCELPNAVYRFDPKTKETVPVITSLKSPNGLAFSKDESLLYVSDSGACQGYDTYYHHLPHHIYVYDVSKNGKKVSRERIFTSISPGFPDGMRVDTHDNLYVGAEDGVQVFNRKAKLIGKIRTPTTATNLTFGDASNSVLFICTIDSIWAIKLNTRGAKPINS